MTPTHTRKGNRRYYYYVSRLSRQRHGDNDKCPADVPRWRLPAKAIEDLVTSSLREHLSAKPTQFGLLEDPDVGDLQAIATRTSSLIDRISAHVSELRTLILRVTIGDDSITVLLDPIPLAQAMSVDPIRLRSPLLSLHVPFTRRRRGVEMCLIAENPEVRTDPVLIRALVRGHRWISSLKRGKGLAAIAAADGYALSTVRTRLPLALLSPRIQSAILDGRQAAESTLEKIVRTRLPYDWCEQERLLGFDG